MKDKEGIGIMNRHTPRKPAIERGTVDVPWIAAYLGINLNAAYALVKTPGFPCIKIGKRFVIPKVAFFRWLEQVALDKQSYDTAENQ
jgi:hypothetical protein